MYTLKYSAYLLSLLKSNFKLACYYFQLKMTPLHWATEKGHIHVIEILLKAGADVTCENKVSLKMSREL